MPRPSPTTLIQSLSKAGGRLVVLSQTGPGGGNGTAGRVHVACWKISKSLAGVGSTTPARGSTSNGSPAGLPAPAALGDSASDGLITLVKLHESVPRAAVDKLVADFKPDLIAAILPAQSTTLRVLDGTPPVDPAASTDDILSSMGLIAEAHLPSTFSSHHRAAGCLPLAGVPGQQPIVIGWVESGGAAESAAVEVVSCGCSRVDVFIPEAVALARAVDPAGGCALLADHECGSALFIKSDAKPIARALRAVPAPAVAFVEQVIRQIGPLWPASAEATRGAAGSIVLSGSTRARAALANVGGWSKYTSGTVDSVLQRRDLLALAALTLCEAGSNAGVLSLLSMRAVAPVDTMLPIARAAEWLGSPRRAMLVGAVCLAALIASPLVVGAVRLQHIKAVTEGGSGSQADIDAANEQVDTYSLLREKRWPMTKLFADIVTAAPEGLAIETINIDFGKRITVVGSADSSDKVFAFRDSLGGNKVFDDVKLPSVEGNSSRFSVNFQVAQATYSPTVAAAEAAAAKAAAKATSTADKAPVDKSTAAKPSTSDKPAAAKGTDRQRTTTPAKDTAATGGTRTNRNGTGAGAASNRVREGTGTSTTPATTPAAPTVARPVEVPGPIGDTEIAALDKNSAMKEWSARKAASQKPDLDQTTRDRLTAEAQKCFDRMKAAGSADGGSK